MRRLPPRVSGQQKKQGDEMKKKQWSPTAQPKRTRMPVRTQVRAGTWKRCGALECDTQDKGMDPNVCKVVRCR